MKKVKKLVINIIIMTGASFLMRTVGMKFTVYLTKIIGSSGIGLFELIMSVYTLAVSLASAGVRLSTTRLVAENAGKNTHTEKEIMSICLRYGAVLGIAAGGVLYILSDTIAVNWLNSAPTAISLRILSLGLPFLSVSSCLNGYFTAVGKAGVYSSAQIIEQFVRIGITLACLKYFLPLGADYACIALVIGSCLAEVLSTLFAMVIYRSSVRKSGKSPKKPRVLKELLNIAVPDAIGSWVRSGLVTAKNLLIPKGLRKTGATSLQALSIYGVIQGMVLPVLSFPSALLYSVSALIVPEIAESIAMHKAKRINYMINRATHITLLFSFAAAGVIFFFADILGDTLYPGNNTSFYISMLAPVIPVMYLDIVVDGVLKGLGRQVSSMKYNIIDAAMCLCLVLFLIPRVGIAGYIFTIYASEILNFFLSIGKLTKVTGVHLNPVKSVLKPLFAIVGMGLVSSPVLSIFQRVFDRDGLAITFSVLICLLVYIIFLFTTGCIGKDENQWIKDIFAGEKQGKSTG